MTSKFEIQTLFYFNFILSLKQVLNNFFLQFSACLDFIQKSYVRNAWLLRSNLLVPELYGNGVPKVHL